MKKIITSFIVSIFLLSLNTNSAQAAALYLYGPQDVLKQNDTFVVDLRIANPEELINAGEGVIMFDKNILTVKDISTGGSIFKIWPQEPIFNNTSGMISFVGGAPNGFQEKDALLMKIIFEAAHVGQGDVLFTNDISLYLNDGKGTRVTPLTVPLSVRVEAAPAGSQASDQWQDAIQADKVQPRAFSIDITRSADMFNNQYYISFYTTDDQSGIDHYEIQEGKGNFEKVISPYVLKDQTLGSSITVRAIDKAGNVASTTYIPSWSARIFNLRNWYWGLGLVLIVIIFALVFKKRNKK